MKILKKVIYIDKKQAELLEKLCNVELKNEEECFGEDESIVYTAKFPNNYDIVYTAKFPDNYEMDIKCCGVRFEENGSNTAWTEAVLFKNGRSVACSEVSDDFFGEWELEANGCIFHVDIVKNED